MTAQKAAYRLTFKHTRATKKAATLKEAKADARYWIDYGVLSVCIQRRLPSGRYTTIKCLNRRHRRK